MGGPAATLRAGDTPPSKLADALGMTRGAISKLVDRLLAKKLLSRTAGKDDKRFQSVSPHHDRPQARPRACGTGGPERRRVLWAPEGRAAAAFADLLKDIVAAARVVKTYLLSNSLP